MKRSLTFDFSDGQHDVRLQRRDDPGDEVEQMRPAFYGLVTPLEAGGKEPGEGQARPPGKCRHATKVQGHKHNRA